MSARAGTFATLDDLTPGPPAGEQSSPDYVSAGLSPQVTFKETDTTPPSIVYVARDDKLRATVYSINQTTSLTGGARLLKADGTIQIYALNIPGLPAQAGAFTSSFDFDLSEGFLLDVAFLVSGTQSIGELFMSLGLVRGTGANALWVQTLVQDYLIGDQAVGWPGSGIKNSLEGPGATVSQVFTNPAAGAGFFNLQMPAGVEWEPVVAHVAYTTSAVVGNRVMSVQCRKVTAQPFIVTFPAVQTASTVNEYMLGTSLPLVNDANGHQLAPLPTRYRMRGGGFDSIRFIVTGADVADQFSLGVVETKQWLRP